MTSTATNQALSIEWVKWMSEAEVSEDTELSCGLTVLDWAEEFTPQEREDWLGAGGFDPASCSELRGAGFTPEECGSRTDLGDGGYSHTIAYKYCNGDLAIDEVGFIVNG